MNLAELHKNLYCTFIIYTAGNSNSYISHVPAVVLSKKYPRLTFI